MSDSIINSLSDGFDPQASAKLQADTNERLSILSQPLNVDTPTMPSFDFTIPKEYSADDLLYSNTNKVDLSQLIWDNDPKKRQLGFDFLAQKTYNDPAVKNDWSDRVYQHQDWMDRYNKDAGLDIEASQAENENRYHNIYWKDASFLSKVGTTIDTWAVKFPILTIGKALGQLVSLGVMAGNIGKIGSGNFWSSVADNETVRWLEDTEQEFKDKVVPIYKSIDYDGKGFWGKLTDATTWNDTVVNAAAFMASAYLTGGGVGKLGTLGKATKIGRFFAAEADAASVGGKLLQTFTGARNVAGVSAHILNTTIESTMQAVGDYRDVKESLLTTINPETQKNYTEEEATKKAGDAAAMSFVFNWVILSMSNALENKWIQKIINNKEAHPLDNILIDQALKASEKPEISRMFKIFGASEKNKIGKFFTENYYGKELNHYLPEAVKGVAMEGWEENTQNAVSRLAKQKYGQGYYLRNGDDGDNIKDSISSTGNIFGDFFKQTYKQTVDALQGNDKENADSIGVGGLIGVLGGAVSTKIFGGRTMAPDTIKDKNGKDIPNPKAGESKLSLFKGERKQEEDERLAKIAELNEARNNFLSINDIFNKDGSVDTAKLAVKQDKIDEFASRFGISNDITDPIIKEQLQKNLFAEYVYAHIKADTHNQLLDRLNNYGKNDKDAEVLKAYGFSQELSENPQDYAELAKQFIDINDKIDNITYKPITNGKPFTAGEYASYENFLKSKVYELSTRSIINNIAIDKITKDIQDNYSKIDRTNEQLNGIDDQIDELNASEDKDGTKATSLDLLNEERKNALKEHNDNITETSKSSLISPEEVFEEYSDKKNQLFQANNHGQLLDAMALLYSDKKKAMNLARSQFEALKNNKEDISPVEETTSTAVVTKTKEQEDKEKADIEVAKKNQEEADKIAAEAKKAEEEASKGKTEEEKKIIQNRVDNITNLKSIDDLNKYYDSLSDEEKKIHNTLKFFQSKKDALLKQKEAEDKATKLNNTTPPPIINPIINNEEDGTEEDAAEPKGDNPIQTEPIGFTEPLPFLTPLKTVTRNSEDDKTNPFIENVNTKDEYGIFQSDVVSQLTPEFIQSSGYQLFIESDTYNVKDLEKEFFNKVKGHVISLKDKDNNNIKIEDIFPDKYNNIHGKPIVFQIDKSAFSKHEAESANILSKKDGITVKEALDFYKQQRELLEKAKLKSEEGIQIPIQIIQISSGASGSTVKYSNLQNRFGVVSGFTINSDGKIIAKTEKGNVQSFTPRVKNTPFFDEIKRVFNTKFATKEEAQKGIAFLKTFIYTQKGKYFFVDVNFNSKTDKSEYTIRYAIETTDNGGIKTNDNIIKEGNMRLNISRDAYDNGYTNSEGKSVSFDEYRNSIIPLLLTNKKIFLDSEGKQYSSPVNSYFSFQIAHPEMVSAPIIKEQPFNKQEVVDKKADIERRRQEELAALNNPKTKEQEIAEATEKWIQNVDEKGFPKESLQPILDAIEEKYNNVTDDNKTEETPEDIYDVHKAVDRLNAENKIPAGFKSMASADQLGFLEYVAQQSNNINALGEFDKERDSRTQPSIVEMNQELKDLANETFPQYKNIANREDEIAKNSTPSGRMKRTSINAVMTPNLKDPSKPLIFVSKSITYTFDRKTGSLEDGDEMSVFLNIDPNAQNILEDAYKTYPFTDETKESSIYKNKIGEYTFYSLPTPETTSIGTKINNEYLFDASGKYIENGLESIMNDSNKNKIDEIQKRNC